MDEERPMVGAATLQITYRAEVGIQEVKNKVEDMAGDISEGVKVMQVAARAIEQNAKVTNDGT